MTTYNEDILSDSFTPNPILPVVGDLLEGTLNSVEYGPDPVDAINLELVAGTTYTFNILAPAATRFYYIPGPEAAAIVAYPEIDGPNQQLTFTASTSGVFSLFVEADGPADYTIDVISIEAPVVIDPNAPTEGDDVVSGTSGADNVMLLGGDDRFTGGNGNDTVDGGDGDDDIFGQGGRDLLNGGNGDDKILGGNADDTIFGGSGKDKIYGEGGADSIDGGAGNDVLSGGGGHDTIHGGNNNDRITGGGGNDFITAGQGNDQLNGQGGDDFLSGGSGKDKIQGGNGDDTIIGGSGDDFLRGGNGIDTFVFADGMNRDTIADFQDGVDLLDYSAMGLFDISQLTVTQLGNHVRITAAPSDFVTIRNTDVSDFSNADFIFDDIFVVG